VSNQVRASGEQVAYSLRPLPNTLAGDQTGAGKTPERVGVVDCEVVNSGSPAIPSSSRSDAGGTLGRNHSPNTSAPCSLPPSPHTVVPSQLTNPSPSLLHTPLEKGAQAPFSGVNPPSAEAAQPTQNPAAAGTGNATPAPTSQPLTGGSSVEVRKYNIVETQSDLTKSLLEEKLTAFEQKVGADIEKHSKSVTADQEALRTAVTELRKSMSDFVPRSAMRSATEVQKSFFETVGNMARAAVAKEGSLDTAIGVNVVKALTYANETGVDVYPQIGDILPQYGVAFSKLHKVPITKTTKFLSATADPVGSFIRYSSTGGLAKDTAITHTPAQVQPQWAGVDVSIPLEVIEDSTAAVGAEVIAQAARAVSKVADYAAFLGNGTADATNGGFTGIFNNTSYDFTTTAASAGAVTYAQILGLLSKVSPTVLSSPNAAFFASPAVAVQLLAIVDGQNRPLFSPVFNKPEFFGKGGNSMNILGYPLVLTNVLPANPTAAGDPILVFGDGLSYNVGVTNDLFVQSTEVGGTAWLDVAREIRALVRFAAIGNAVSAFAGIKHS